MMPCRVLILTAIYPEARAIARAFRLDTRSLAKGLTGDAALALGVAGIGAARGADLLALAEPQLIIMAGLAGALAARLRVGDIVVEGAWSNGSSTRFPTAGGSQRGDDFAVYPGKIYSSRTIISTPAEKAALHRATGALAVDMETHVVATLAAARGTPFQAVRAISDAADEPLDPRLLSLIDSDGRPRLGRVAALLGRHPGQLAALLRMKRAADLALDHLSRYLAQCDASDWQRFDNSSPGVSPVGATCGKNSKAL